MMEEQTKNLNDYLMALRRRKTPILLIMGCVFVIMVLVAFLLPPVYRSTATILIEEQEIPQDLVRSTITSFADQRIQMISQQVMTRANLMQIVEKYNLYPDERRRKTTEEVLEEMRRDIGLEMVRADVMDRLRGAKTVATIAFRLSYSGEKAATVQKVANELVSLYLNENIKNRQQKAAETSDFLTDEANKLSEHISAIEAKLAEFKAKNIGKLPELTNLNMQMRDSTEREVQETDRQISSMEQQKIYLEGQLAQINPYTDSVSASGQRILNVDDRLKVLQSQYAGMVGVYSPNHPDVVKMRREMEALKKEAGGDASDAQEKLKQLSNLRGELATTREKYSEGHPDVVKLKKSIALLEESLKQSTENAAVSARARKPENPAYITLQSQLEAIPSTLKMLQAKRSELKSKMADLEARLQQTPLVEREYLDMNREHESAMKRYQEIKGKQMEAQVAQQLEKDSKAERFSLIDPPQLPEKPDSPNRPSILLLGIALSFGGGLAYAGMMESIDTSVRSSRDLAAIVAAPLLATIPYMENTADKARKKRTKRIVLVSGISVFVVSLLLIHFFWVPLDVLWYRILRVVESYLPAANHNV